ncbi:unnamed protein product [Rotaria sordida]|uniref:NAD(P)(+)--arginine ADP-ribosyltransferase n=1 Tax=Rotaria sordida TaxID=392033 RepID=A0A814ZNL2_9BILA|nr:unnamed protein product [Rotaria sordida]
MYVDKSRKRRSCVKGALNVSFDKREDMVQVDDSAIAFDHSIHQNKLDDAQNDEEANNQRQIMSNNSSQLPLHELPWNLNEEENIPGKKHLDDSIVNSMSKNYRVVDTAAAEENSQTTQKIVNNDDISLEPIVEYAQEPLLPLAEACAPLIDIIDDILTYVQLALDDTPDEPANGLTVDESASIRLYTIEWPGFHRSLYSKLNRALKAANREELRPYFKYLKLLLTAVVKLPCVSRMTIWRGVTKDYSANFPPGELVTWWTFSSCTTTMTVLENNLYLGTTGPRTLFSIEAINGRSIQAHSHFAKEDEILLLPGTRMEVQSQMIPATDLHIIHIRQIVPNEVLLEPPFEGAYLYPKNTRKWYQKKRFLLPMFLLTVIALVAIILGSVLGTILGKKGTNFKNEKNKDMGPRGPQDSCGGIK